MLRSYNEASVSYIVLQQKRGQMREIHRGGGFPGGDECEQRTQTEMNVCPLIKQTVAHHDHYQLIIHSLMSRDSGAIFVC